MPTPNATHGIWRSIAVVAIVISGWSALFGLASACNAQPVLYASGSGGVSPWAGNGDGQGVGPGAGPGSSPGQSHGWVAVPSMSGTALVHVPPRKPGLTKAALDGTMRQARELKVPPVAIAGIGDRVYVISDVPEIAGVAARRSVESLRALPSAVGDLWYFEPDGHLLEHPDLPARGQVDGFIGTGIGPVALVDSQLLLLDERGWNEIDPPSPLIGRGWDSASRLIALDGRAAILTVSGNGGMEVWSAQITAPSFDRPEPRSKRRLREPREGSLSPVQTEDAAADLTEYRVLWSMQPYAADGSLARRGLAGPWIGEINGVLTYVGGRDDGSVVVGTITRQSSYELATVPGVGGVFGVVPVEDASRVAIVWLEKEPEGAESGSRAQRRSFPAPIETPNASSKTLPLSPQASDPTGTPKPSNVRVRGHLEVREISVFTGAVLFAGPQRGDGPVSAFEVQLLAGVLVLVMIVVLILVLTREPDNGVFHLPRGTTMAEPGRRALAGIIDLAIAILIADKVWGVPMSDLLGPNRIFSGEALWVLGSAILIGLVMGTVGEWLTGRSFGKAMTRCAVVDARATDAKATAPKFWQALVRNLVKWLAAPAAILGLMESAGRHRGDALSRTLVCLPTEDDEESNDENESRG